MLEIGRRLIVLCVACALPWGCASSRGRAAPVALELLPSRGVIYKLEIAMGFEDWDFALVARGLGRPAVQQLRLEYSSGGKRVALRELGAEALEGLREEGTAGEQRYQFLHELMPASAKVDHLRVTALSWSGDVLAVGEAALSAYSPRRRYALPLRGCWRVTSGHDFGGEHRRWYNRAHFAWDLMKTGKNGATASAPGLEAHLSFGAPVYAPAEGQVVLAEGSFPDNPVGTSSSSERANYLLIDHGDGEFSKLQHLKQGSLLVAPGDRVRQGQEVAQVGNSGRTDGPHLHLQFEAVRFTPDGRIAEERPLPIPLSGYFEPNGEALRRVEQGRPRRGDYVCSDPNTH